MALTQSKHLVEILFRFDESGLVGSHQRYAEVIKNDGAVVSETTCPPEPVTAENAALAVSDNTADAAAVHEAAQKAAADNDVQLKAAQAEALAAEKQRDKLQDELDVLKIRFAELRKAKLDLEDAEVERKAKAANQA